MDNRRILKKLKEEASLGYCLKEAMTFMSDVDNQCWKCPFCEDYTLMLPSEEQVEAWGSCQTILNTHLNAHRSLLLQATPLETLQLYEKKTKQSSRRARIWVNGTMADYGFTTL